MIPTAIHWTCGNGLPEADSYRDIVVLRDVSFDRSGDEPHRRMDVYRPAGPPRGPTWVCWYGGAFIGGRKEAMSRVAAYLAHHGMPAVTPNYRVGNPAAKIAAWPKAILDARAAVAFLRTRGEELRFGTEVLVGLGHSSGAYLAMMCGFLDDETWAELHGQARAEEAPSFKPPEAVVNIAGVTDRRGVVSPSQLALLGRGYEADPELQERASVLPYVAEGGPPVYSLHGLADKTVSPDHADKLDVALKAAGIPHRLNLLPGAGHDPVTPEALDDIRAWAAGLPAVAAVLGRPAE